MMMMMMMVMTTYLIDMILFLFFPHVTEAPSGPRPPHYRGFTITLRHPTLGVSSLDRW
jgi:hypothetical protein